MQTAMKMPAKAAKINACGRHRPDGLQIGDDCGFDLFQTVRGKRRNCWASIKLVNRPESLPAVHTAFPFPPGTAAAHRASVHRRDAPFVSPTPTLDDVARAISSRLSPLTFSIVSTSAGWPEARQ